MLSSPRRVAEIMGQVVDASLAQSVEWGVATKNLAQRVTEAG